MLPLCRCTIVTLALLALAGAAKAGLVVEFDSQDTVVHVGDTFDVRITMTTDEEILGWGLDLLIVDETVASLVGTPVVGPLWDPFATPDGDGLGGLAFPDPIGPGDDFLLATLTFTAHEIGETDLILSYSLVDFTEGFINDSGFAVATLLTGTITVVPAPGALSLFFMGAAASRRRRRSI